jgi:hypothetical protein
VAGRTPARGKSIKEVFGRDLDLHRGHPHGSNILTKACDKSVTANTTHYDLIRELALAYARWRHDAESLEFNQNLPPNEFVAKHTALYTNYRDMLDEVRFDVFDSRGALQPSALEEFCTFLFEPLTRSFDADVFIGHQDVFKGLYFTSPRFSDFARLPIPKYPRDNVDFVIGKRLSSEFATDKDKYQEDIYVPAVAVECKTYLDRPRWNECDLLASNVKRGFPRCKFLILSEFLKLDLDKVNIIGSLVDHIYVLRRAKNVDRKSRREHGVTLSPIHVPAVLDFYNTVAAHLTADWEAPEDWQHSGILK